MIREYQYWLRNQQRAFDRIHSEYMQAMRGWSYGCGRPRPKSPQKPDWSCEAFVEQSGRERITGH